MTKNQLLSPKNILALIPARGGSKGVPRKNLVPILGRPLISYTIEQALASRWITRTIVSTEDAEIAAVARQHGADVPFLRPAELARDESLDLDVFDYVLRQLKERENYECDAVVHLRATGPVRRVDIMDRAIKTFLDHPEATALRCVNVPEHTPYKMWRIEHGFLTPLLQLEGVAEPHSQPRQKLPPVYWHNPYVDVIRPGVILNKRSMCGDRILPFVIEENVFDIDTPECLPQVEQAMKRLLK